MLNISFSKVLQKSITEHYVAPSEIAQYTIKGNEENDTGLEFRTQSVFGEEIWIKLERAGLSPKVFDEADVLEVCAATGFLTHHLLKRCQPKRLTVNDISFTELKMAALQAGFRKVTTIPWGLIRPIIVQQGNLHLSKSKPVLTANEVKKMEYAIKADAFLNKFLPQRSFGSICLICQN